MGREVYRHIIELVREIARLAKSVGIKNILQPGLVKEMIIADILGHELIHSKRDADARSRQNPDEKYEYLSCQEGGTGQLDRMFNEPTERREESFKRITRNAKVYLAIFDVSDPTKCKIIYELTPESVKAETERQLNKSRNAISHVGFSESWAKEHGHVVWRDGLEQ
ncbi:MAG: hypothetical protein ACRC46_11000 [Thermoguttaceae bacterium]